ncbi:hypothetical protein LMH87_001428 [Akanthomyces muscarius]|uniref:Grh/CP2 DB domain-containing protein n=1 Tax=Akanthomyces muscarius TaxID=2231603 RepID=A0A9W8Q5N2_AKAMU|nr:hypothetical protein LMH87_001428 [Akanthomyces muscarius]KAJ4146869.1 hypothetical protein LMH87_001428 [Akanthomyces muscarius]
MFSQRTNSQKADDELLAKFRQQFPQIGATTEGGSAGISQTAGFPDMVTTASAPLRYAASFIMPPPALHTNDHSIWPELHEQKPAPRANNDPWRFSPSLLDPNSFANDLYAPTMAMLHCVTTPLGAPHSLEAMQSGAGMDPSAIHTVPSQHMPHFQPYLQVLGQTLAPSSFVHQDTGYETMKQDPSPMGFEEPDARLVGLLCKSPQMANAASMSLPLPPSAERFRFHSTLNAPTAMVKEADEIPITYLNKGQTYPLSIADTQGARPVQPGTRYRTLIRVSFEDEE